MRMSTRELVAAVAIPIVLLGILWLPPWFFLALVGLAVVIAQIELLQMARNADLPCVPLVPTILLITTLAATWIWAERGAAAATLLTLIAVPAFQLLHPSSPRRGLIGAAVSTFSVLYLGLGGACVGWLRLLPEELGPRALPVLFLVSIWLGDSGAYYVGRAFGRHRMSPRISPKKTWEGLAGGVVATCAAVTLGTIVLGLPLGWPHALGLALILSITAPVGDLVESLFKRDLGVKDSSGLLLGHGGFLDRTDSLVFSAPPVLVYLLLIGARS
jgi:phosphatidate cytidylyltransferase